MFASLVDLDSWSVVTSHLDPRGAVATPQQENGFDCGPFTCMFADYLSLGLQPRFSQSDINLFRARITLTILDAHERYRNAGDLNTDDDTGLL